MFQSLFQTPFGIAILKASELGLTEFTFDVDDTKSVNEDPNEHIKQAKTEIDEYFNQKRNSFNVPLDLSSGSPFYQKVWQELLNIPYGTTTSYKKLSIKIGDVKAIRAVGTANGRNPIAIIVPCHRVIGSDGSLTGYAHGLDMKRRLLHLEQPQAMGLQASLF